MPEDLDDIILSSLDKYLLGDDDAVYALAFASFASWDKLNAADLLVERARLKSLATERYGDRGEMMVDLVMNRWNSFVEHGK